METTRQFKFMIAGFCVVILLMTMIPVSAEKTIMIKKTLDVPKNSLEKSLANVEEYNKIFPEYVKSAEVIREEENYSLSKVKMGLNGFYIDAGIEHTAIDNDLHQVKILSSDFKGTTITTSLQETWGYDGTPNMGTDVKVKISLQISGWLGFLGLISEEMVSFSIDKSLVKMAEHASS